ncbi:MAG TPA: lipoprotein insertase outer membrane protein LolB [Steroidobacteraceae bacterium]|nr:lipoprotein insertase outer membrane protein LolB [Steroidobacteraceae bacterium]
MRSASGPTRTGPALIIIWSMPRDCGCTHRTRSKVMRTLWVSLFCCAALSACVTTRPTPPPAAVPWDQRSAALQHADTWQLAGRAAVAVGTQGWQASLDWQQHGDAAELHLAGPLGVGALVLDETPAGLSLNGAPPSDAVLAQLQERLGFELPLNNLRYWLLGVPDPGSAFDLRRNDQDRAALLTQAGWTLTYDKYMRVNGDLLPARLVLARDAVRVRIAVDHWEGVR